MHTRVLVLLALQMRLVYSFSWDIVEGVHNRLEFSFNGTIMRTEQIQLPNDISAVTYDPVHYRVLFAHHNNVNISISSFDLSTSTIQPILTSRNQVIYSVTYDPVTQLLFWVEGFNSIYSFPIELASSTKVIDKDPLVSSEKNVYAIAVDSCSGYIYWTTDYNIERARFDGTDREVLIDKHVHDRQSLAIDQQTQKLYWIEKIQMSDNQIYIESSDLKGINKTTVFIVKKETIANSLTVSEDFIYWFSDHRKAILQLHKNPSQRVKAQLQEFSKSYSDYCWFCQRIAANYTIAEQTQGNRNCETPTSSSTNHLEPDINVLCVHGAKVSGEARCECTQGYTGERCDVDICQNYCFQGDCSVSADGQPKCRCKVGYSGKRCKVNACHKHCLNNGTCSLNDEGDPVCQCTAGYVGDRCEIPSVLISCIQTVSMLKDMLNADIPSATVSKAVESTCASTDV